jgi:hypothetical protein
MTCLVGLLFIDPIPQDPAYHLFADMRSFFGIPNFNDVVSNAGFSVIGVLGVLTVMGVKGQSVFRQRSDTRPYMVFFISVALVSLGSAYYHWAPSNERLLLDRLPIAAAFMAFCAAIVADRIDAHTGNAWLLAIFVIVGLLSLIYWHWTEIQGRGDLRFYGFVQFYPMAAMPLVCWLFPEHRYTAGRYVIWVIVWYGIAKLLEIYDQEIFEFSGRIVSGHTLKHVAATLATYVVLRMIIATQTASADRN